MEQLPSQFVPSTQNVMAHSAPVWLASHGYAHCVHGARAPSRELRGLGYVIAPWPCASVAEAATSTAARRDDDIVSDIVSVKEACARDASDAGRRGVGVGGGNLTSREKQQKIVPLNKSLAGRGDEL
jgi:hypothetical protein